MSIESKRPIFAEDVARMVKTRRRLDVVIDLDHPSKVSLAVRGARPIIAMVLPVGRINVPRLQERSGSADPAASVDMPFLIVRDAKITLLGILKELPPFLANYYPEACNKPVNVHGISNRRNHRTPEPIARL